MFFSVIIPVYNVEKYLRQCLNSVVQQTFSDYEVILIDDGSTDSSGQICDTYQSSCEKIRVIHQQNQGLSGARNTGLDHAAGDWIVFIDSDDFVEPDMLSGLAAYLERYDPDLLSYNFRLVNEQGKRTGKILYAVENELLTFSDETERLKFYLNDFMEYKTGWEACNRVFRHSIIRQYHMRFRPTQEVLAEDYLFSFEYLLHIRNYLRVCNLFYSYRQRSDSLNHTVDLKTAFLRLQNFADYIKLLTADNRIFRKSFAVLYFKLMNYHIQYKYRKYDMRPYLAEAEKAHRKLYAKMRKQREELKKEMIFKEWL